jgi:hypothetical protein
MPAQIIENVELLITAGNQLQESLSDAEARLRQTAIAHGAVGILVTRHDARRYTLALSDSVPFGETHEKLLS